MKTKWALGWMYQSWQGKKIIVIALPIILPLFLGAMTFFATHDTEMTLIAAVAALAAALFFSVIYAPTLFVYPDTNPSRWQRFCRTYTINLSNALLKGQRLEKALNSKRYRKRLQEIRYFQYWLSHPDVNPTSEQCEKIAQADTSKFDWQDPAKWPDFN